MKTIDPSAPEALADKASFYNHMREECPVARVETAEGEHYVITGYDNVKKLLNDYEHYSKAWGSQFAPMEYHVGLNQDPPDFLQYKAIYNAYMSPNGVKRWRGDCLRIAEDLVDKLEPLGSGDLQELFGKPLPARVAAIALGFPEDNVEKYRAWTDGFLNAMIRNPERQMQIIEELYAFFDEQMALVRDKLRAAGIAEPGPEHVGTVIPDSLTSVLMVSKFKGRYLTDEEVRRTVRGFFIGGVDTTGALILNTLHQLLRRDLWKDVVANPALITPAIDESLRFEPPAIGMFRGATTDIRIGDNVIPAGARVLYSLYGANRDPAQFDDPDSFRLDRKMTSDGYHISFGQGAHFCPGAWTARLEAKTAIEVLARRVPKLRLTGKVTYFDVINFTVVKTFPAAWD